MVAPSNTPTSNMGPLPEVPSNPPARGSSGEAPSAPPVPLVIWQVVFALVSTAIGGVASVLPELRDTHGLTNTTVGVIAAAGFLAAFVAQGVIAPLTDQWPRRPLILVGMAAAVLGLVGMAIGATGAQLVVARVVIGLGTGVVVPTVRAAVALTDRDSVAENQGRLVVGEMAGFVVGPSATAFLTSSFGLEVAFLILAGGLALFLPLVLRVQSAPAANGHIVESRRNLLRRPRLRGAMVMIGGYALGLGAFEAVLPLQLADAGVSTASIGLFFTAFVMPIALSSVIGGRLADRIGPLLVATGGMLAGSTLAMFMGFAPNIWWIAILLVLSGVADGFGFTASLAVTSAAVPAERQTTALGMVGASEVLLAGLGALPAAWLFDRYGPEIAWLVMGLSMIILVTIGASLCWRSQPDLKAPPKSPGI